MKSNLLIFRALCMMVFIALVICGGSVYAQSFTYEVKNDRVVDANHFRFTIWMNANSGTINYDNSQFTLTISKEFINGNATVHYVSGSSDLGGLFKIGATTYATKGVKGLGSDADLAVIRLNNTSVPCSNYMLSTTPVRWAEIEIERTGNGSWGCTANKLAFYTGVSGAGKTQSDMGIYNASSCTANIIPVSKGSFRNDHLNNQTPVMTHPVSITNSPNNDLAQFSIAAVNVNPGTSGIMTYQWMENGIPLSDFGTYSGTNTSTLTIKNPSESLSGNNYTCTAALCGSVTSGPAILNVNDMLNTAAGESKPFVGQNTGNANDKNANNLRSSDLNSGIQSMDIVASPNPANNRVTVEFNNPVASNYILRIMDIAGRIVMSQANAASQGINKVELNVSSFAEGTYMLSLLDANGSRQIKVNVKH